jgi:excisionase family DNA binding protein
VKGSNTGGTNDRARRDRGSPSSGLEAGDAPGQSERLLLDSREVGRLLGCGRSLVFQLIAQGELPTVRIGRLVRVPRQALEAWIALRTEAPALRPWDQLGFAGVRPRTRRRP